jgi:hypothetical protein
MEKTTCYICLKEKETLAIRDFEWKIVAQSELKCCGGCISKAVKQIAPWKAVPKTLEGKDLMLQKNLGIQIALVAHFKREYFRRQLQILNEERDALELEEKGIESRN